MGVLVLGSRLLLAAVFLLAGITKLADRKGSRKAFSDFGVPTRLASSLAILLPLVELTVALALVPVSSAWLGGVGALALLVIFVLAIGTNLARGRTPDCHCFGQLHSAPIGWATVARNTALAAVAGIIVWQGREDVGPSVATGLSSLTAAQAVLLVGAVVALGFIGFEGWLLLHLFRQNGRLMLRMDALEQALAAVGNAPVVPVPNQPHIGLPIGATAPAFNLPSFNKSYSLEDLLAKRKPVMLIFSDPGCGPCNALLPAVGRWQKEHRPKLTVALISRGGGEANRPGADEHRLTHVLLQKDREVAESYQAYGTPMAVIVRPDGTIGSALVGGTEAIGALVASTVGARMPAPMAVAHGGNGNGHAHGGATERSRPAAKIGDPAPDLKLPDLDGRTISLMDFKGSRTLVLFWNPGCGFCTKMLEELKTWEVNQRKGAPKLLVISTGTVEANRALGFKSRVALDQSFNVASLFGAGGTPSAVLISEKGEIDSQVVVGGPAVLALAGVEQR